MCWQPHAYIRTVDEANIHSVTQTHIHICTYHARFPYTLHTYTENVENRKQKQQIQQFWLTDILLLRRHIFANTLASNRPYFCSFADKLWGEKKESDRKLIEFLFLEHRTRERKRKKKKTKKISEEQTDLFNRLQVKVWLTVFKILVIITKRIGDKTIYFKCIRKENVRNNLMYWYFMRKQKWNVCVLVCSLACSLFVFSLFVFFLSTSAISISFSRSLLRALCALSRRTTYIYWQEYYWEEMEETFCSSIREIAKRQKALSIEWSQHSLD